MDMNIKEHKILPTGLHCLIDDKGRVHVYTEEQYSKLMATNLWWKKIKLKYFRNG